MKSHYKAIFLYVFIRLAYDLGSKALGEYPVTLNIIFFVFIEIWALYWFNHVANHLRKERFIIRALAIPSVIRIVINISAFGLTYNAYYDRVNWWVWDMIGAAILLTCILWSEFKHSRGG